MDHPEGFSKENTSGEVKKELYTLDVVFGKKCEDSYYAHYHSGAVFPAPKFPKLGIIIIDGKYHLSFREQSVKSECFATERKITFNLTCPYVFGDEKIHEIATFWKTDKIESFNIECYKIVFDGKEITEVFDRFNHNFEANIILDRSN